MDKEQGRSRDSLPRFGTRKFEEHITIWIPASMKAKYDKLTKEHKVRVPEVLRYVIDAELDRLLELINEHGR